MGNNGPHKNPILTLCTPQRLLDTSSAAAAALRMSMLSTSIAHLENELTAREKRRRGCGCRCQNQGRDGDSNGDLNMERNRLQDEDPHLDRGRAAYLHVRDRLREVGKRFKTAALANIVLVEEDESDQFDTVLATCVIIMMRDVISASDWSENFEYAIRLVSKRGGPQAVLSSDPTNFTRRFLLENLTTHDIFSCFITQKEPVLMDRFDPWWYSCIETSSRSWEWESVERTFGISRGMVDFIARVVTLNAQKRRLRIDFTSPASDAGMYKVESFMRRQAESLLLELDVWHNGLSTLSQHVRVDCGDYIYKYMCCVYILGEILDQPVNTPRITSSIDYVLELCSEATALRQVVMLVWPLLICGSFCLSSVRGKVLSLLDAFEDDYCEDLRVAREIVLEQWKCMDEGLGRRSFGEVMMRIGKYVLLI
ncbi:fungal-specific transcription factor domain-containing protein [Filobasidium floriforme]|uniref:fungal-specific transcription factor domain-containing protein n=1 Tax=Filobasidium floriforme TaxID=5210 RepID=UPI001E8CEAF4|nr:fungal-specific transcription factor domain-containing protein [Filobasidium floriforme]KAH8080224.1 fungal-specific transcription factor domain-containing protein [Filobasidium floriforme]